jgi:DNA-binding beta-propeller fold protein YncE
MVVSTIPVGFNNPLGVVITPDGTRAYVEDTGEFLNIIDSPQT